MPNRAAISAYLTILSGSAGRLVISLVYFLIVANRLSLADFGLFATASATGVILSRMLAFGFVSPLFRIATVKPRLLGAYLAGFGSLSLASLPFIAGIAAIAYVALFRERIDLLTFTMIVAAEVLGWRLVEVVAIVNNGLRRFRQAAMLVVIGAGLRTVAALLFVASGQANLEIWAVAYLAATAVAAIIAFAAFLPRRRWRFSPALYPRRMKDAVHSAAAEILFYVQSELDKLVVLAFAGEQTVGLYAIVLRIVDLTAMPVRSFNQMLVQKIMTDRSLVTGRRLAFAEIGIFAISVAGLAAIVVLLHPYPALLGRNVAEASYLFLPMLLVPAFRNLVEYHAELLYAREHTGTRIALLSAIALLKAGLIAGLMLGWPAPAQWAAGLNLVFGAVYLLSVLVTYRLLLARTARPGFAT